MRRTSFAGRLRSTVLIAGIALCESSVAHAWSTPQHRDQLTPMALDLVKLQRSAAYPREIWETYRSFIIQGSWDEDYPCGIFGIRAGNHFRHPLSGRGLTDSPWTGLGDPDADAFAWALENRDLDPGEEFREGDSWAFRSWGWSAGDVDHGDMSWKKAVARYGYTDDSKRLAYYTLGFVCHILQDMGAPEHVHDDPHGASSFTGFEWWVWSRWDDLKPPVPGDLRPRRFDTLEGFFGNLSFLGYSIDRFRGGALSEGEPPIDPSSDLARMFRVRYRRGAREWVLGNRADAPIIGLSSPGGGTDFLNRRVEWNPADYAKSPIWTKGHDEGEWWPTSVEIPGSALNDADGYYYIELSGDLPGPSEGMKFVADPGRNFLPAAFLPSPLPEVADQCALWRTDSVGGESLYSLIGSRIFPAVVEHSAGLVEHFFDIVNHPPFVRSVEICQASGYRCAMRWEDAPAPPSDAKTITDVAERRLVRDNARASAPDGNAGLSPGSATVRIAFSEPVRSVAVAVGGRALEGFLDSTETVWTGETEIAAEGPARDTLVIAVLAVDLNGHFGNVGGTLDADPATPAKRVEAYPAYSWMGYESGEDAHYAFSIERMQQETREEPPESRRRHGRSCGSAGGPSRRSGSR